jgi:hypothetical protein
MEPAAKDTFTTTFDLFVRKAKATVRQGDGYANNILTTNNKKMFEVIPKYLAELVIKIGNKTKIEEKDILDLWVVDQEWTLVENYKANYGNILELDGIVCPEKQCRKADDHSIDLNDLKVICLPDELKGSEDPTITITLPRSNMSATVGLLNGHQEQILLRQQATGKFDLNQADYQCLRELNGSRDFAYEDVVKLPLLDHKMIRKTRKKLVCGYDTNLELECRYCGATWLLNFLSHRDFLIPAG